MSTAPHIFPDSDRRPTLVYGSRSFPIKFEDGKLVCLTDLWRAAGEPKDKDPRRWIDNNDTQGFVDALCSQLNVFKEDILQTKQGRYGGTYSHWQIAANYAKYLSPEFNIAWNNFAAAYIRGYTVTETPSPALTDASHAVPVDALGQIGAALMQLLSSVVVAAVDQAIEKRMGDVPQHTRDTWETVRGAKVIETEVVRTEIREWVAEGYCYLAVEPNKGLMSVGRTNGGKTPEQRMRDDGYNGAKGGDGAWRITGRVQTDDHIRLENKLHRLVESAGAEKIPETRGTYRINERIVADFKRLPAKIKFELIDQFVSAAHLFPLEMFYTEEGAA